MHSFLLTTLNAKYIHQNLAIRLLYALNKNKANLHWHEFTIKNSFTQVAQHCAQYSVVCFSCYIWNIEQTLQVCTLIKQINPNTKILLGGPEVSYDWQEVLVHDAVDYIIVGEGEIPFANFLQQYPNITGLKNIAYKQSDMLCFDSDNTMFDINELENINPYIYEPAEEIAQKVSYIETSRGCPYKCEFCLASLDNKVRYLPIDTIKQNLLYLMQHGKTIKFLDRTFNIKRDFTLDIFAFILENHRPQNVFQFEITADILHPDIIKFIQEKVPPGLFRFEIGIQTVNQKANLEVSRKQSFLKTSNIIHQVRNYVDLHLDLIVGLPLDYFEDIKYSIEEVFKLYPPELQLGFLKFLKGTPVRYKSAQHGYEYQATAPYQIIKSNYLSAQQLADIVLLEEALEIYWNKNRTRHLLQYITTHYSIFDFLLGLGQYFKAHANFHKHTLFEIYDIAKQFIQHFAPTQNDTIALELLAVDFYSRQKIRPGFNILPPLSKAVTFSIIENKKLNHHKFKYVALQLSFNYQTWQTSQQVVKNNSQLIFEFSGVALPRLLLN
jgi:anaerobic magnesium-protoporphyrin IX monomethyl ester cyclase